MNNGLMKKASNYYKKFGVMKTIKRIFSYIKFKTKNKYYGYIISKNKSHDDFWEPLKKILVLNQNNIEFIDIFHVPMGWNTPLFQRFQHMSLNVGKIGGLAFYGAHPTVDKDVKVIKKINDKLYLVNFEDYNVKKKFFEILDSIQAVKIIRLQSIDLATTVEEVQSFMDRGYKILYEYIDELTPDITGDMPGFVWDRHEFVLRNEAISVVATSDNLYNKVLKYRNKNCILSCNGVDYEHWRNINVDNIPNDIKDVVNQNKVIVGYHGALAKWSDYDLLKAIADDGRYILLLIGYEHDLSFANSGIKSNKNVAYLGHKSYQELNKYCQFYDVAIIPFIINDITQSVSPVKLFEYMAAGKPIVTYNLRECYKYKSCLIASNKVEFLEKIEEAVKLKNNKEYIQTLKTEALQNTWINKTFEMKELVLDSINNEKTYSDLIDKQEIKDRYIEDILRIPDKSINTYVNITDKKFERKEEDPKVIAYYLPQFYPFEENDKWWGKGTTEWNNVCKAVPQYVGHYQPRLPGELGFYDLRLKGNIERQVELAKMYGVYGFCYYYYSFDGKRMLDKPLDLLVNSKDIDMPFCLCWANENWTKRFDGTNQDVIMKQSDTVESYREVIKDIANYMKDERYISISGKKVLIIYRPSFIPNFVEVLTFWRTYCLDNNIGDIYIIAVKENTADLELLKLGFDAVSEFHPGTVYRYCDDITDKKEYIRKDFSGQILDYKDIVDNKKYFKYNTEKLYRAVMPMWDNTARRNNKGMIFENATPELYKQWLEDVLIESKNKDLDDSIVFINAWNEWGEGTYLEPDKKYGYAYLEKTKEAIIKSRKK